MSNPVRSAVTAVLVAGIVAVGVAGPAAAQSVAGRGPDTVGSATPAVGDQRVASFSDSFTFRGTTYPYTMVGTNPHRSTATTTVPTEIIPLRVVFSDGTVIDGTPRVAAVLASPIFQPADFVSGHTQYGDAVQRAEFWGAVSANGGGYHALLGQPTVLPTQTVRVPGPLGHGGVAHGVPYGLVTDTTDRWWSLNVVQRLIGQLHLDPASLPIFLSDGVYLGDPPECCTTGFHGVYSWGAGPDYGPVNGQGHQKISTYIWASWTHREHFGKGNPLSTPWYDLYVRGGDIDTLSHEIAEWYNDPFVNDYVPAWLSPLPGPQLSYGCSNALETGDPVTSESLAVNGYHLQDEAFLPWFTREAPSSAINGQYDLAGLLTEPAPLC